MSEPLLVKFRSGPFKTTVSVRDLNNAGESNPDAIIAYVVSETCNGVAVPLSDLWTGAQQQMKEIAIEEYHKLKATIK